MNLLTSRPYAGPADLQAATALTQALRAAGQTVYPIAADLYEELSEPVTQASTRLWHNAAGDLLGFAYVSRWQNLVDVFDARVMTPALENEMMAAMEEAVRQRNLQSGETQTLDASALESDRPRLALLERHAFVRQPESSFLLARPLSQPIPEPQLPPGFSIRPLAGEAELEAYVALHQAAFGTDNMTVEYRRTIMSAPDFIPALDLVVVAPDGALAGLCVCQIFADDEPRAGGLKEGWTDPVAVHPDYQRLGLARALILTGMRLLLQRGVDTAILGTSSTNTAMRATAESLGFRVGSNTLWFSKAV